MDLLRVTSLSTRAVILLTRLNRKHFSRYNNLAIRYVIIIFIFSFEYIHLRRYFAQRNCKKYILEYRFECLEFCLLIIRHTEIYSHILLDIYFVIRFPSVPVRLEERKNTNVFTVIAVYGTQIRTRSILNILMIIT